ncbi:MAG: sporulation integral membrane protein YtvI [Clostridiales bacterium]
MDIKLTPQIKKIIKALFSALTLLLLIFILLNASIILLPFLISFIISLMLEPLVKFLNTKLRINKKLSSMIALFAFLSTIGLSLFFAISKLFTEISDLSKNLNTLYKTHQEDLVIQFNDLQKFYESLPDQTRSTLETNLSKLSVYLIDFAEKLLNGLLGLANFIPGFLIAIVVAILSIYFILSDRDTMEKFIKEQIPKKWLDTTKSLIDNIFVAIIKYLKAQLILIFISFIILLIGFLVLDIKYALLIAFLTCFIDALPVLGIGSVLVPWSIFLFIFGSVKIAVGLLILYGVVVVVRQVMEPKVYGTQMGVHPFVAIMAMYVGLNYFGILGLILSPIIVMVAKNILAEAIKSKKLIELFEPPSIVDSNNSLENSSSIETSNQTANKTDEILSDETPANTDTDSDTINNSDDSDKA